MREVCLVVPCYDEEHRLRSDALLAFLASHSHVSLCLVNDGSRDGTLGVLEALKAREPGRISVVSLPRNEGKAEAVRQGVLQSAGTKRFDFIGYWDADLSTPLDEVALLLAPFDADPACMAALGSRIRRLGSSVERNAARHYFGRVFSTLASLALDVPVYDSQCGAKIFRAEIVPVLFGEPFLTRWVFDVEILARLRNHLGKAGLLAATVEVPLRTWTAVGGSKLRGSHMVRATLELARIRARYGSG